MNLVRRRYAGGVRIVHDRLVGHEQPDHIGQFVGVGEIDGVRSPIDDPHQDRIITALVSCNRGNYNTGAALLAPAGQINVNLDMS